MMVEFDVWGEKDWNSAGPTGSKTEDFPGYKKKYGGIGFTVAGRIFISKGAKWRRAIFWHEKGHCLLFEAGRTLIPTNTSLQEEIWADTIADVLAGTYQTLGMLVMVLKRAKGRNVADTRKRIQAVCERHPKEAQEILKKLTKNDTTMIDLIN